MTEHWKPVEDGMYGFGNLWPTAVTVYGANLEMSNEAVTFPDDIRLCRRVESSAFDRIRAEMEEARAVPATEKYAAGLLRALEILQESDTP